MKLRIACALVAFLSLMLSLTQLAVAQTAAPTASALPRLMRFGGTVKELSGSPLSGVVGITFAFYSEQSGGAPLWLETQNATVDGNGHYAVLLGSTKPDGLPAELFISEQARWVGVQVSGQAEQPRVLLVSAPYALKAGDAETIGGLPPSAFVLAAPQNGSASTYVAESSTAQSVSSGAAADVTTTGGTADYLPIFNGADTIIDSVLYQMGTGATAKVGINTTTPATTLDLNGAATVRGTLALPAVGAATATAGRISQPLTLAASAYNSSTPAAVNQTFQWQAEPTDNDTATPSATLDLLFGEGTTAPSLTGLRIASNGRISFATGQTFPGTGDGTLTGITTAIGSGLTGGGTSGTLKLGLLTSCASGQVLEWNGTVWACATASGSGTITGVTTSASSGLTGGGTSGTLNLQVNTALIPKLASANTFTTQQTITGSNTTQILNVTQSGAGLAIVAKGGVSGSSTAAAGSGVLGTGTGTEGYGVYGSETATIGNGYGVYGTNNTQAGAGVAGYAANTSYGIGVLGSSPSGIGVEGTTSGTASYGV
jgi:trimeric autotransporter adhesin